MHMLCCTLILVDLQTDFMRKCLFAALLELISCMGESCENSLRQLVEPKL